MSMENHDNCEEEVSILDYQEVYHSTYIWWPNLLHMVCIMVKNIDSKFDLFFNIILHMVAQFIFFQARRMIIRNWIWT